MSQCLECHRFRDEHEEWCSIGRCSMTQELARWIRVIVIGILVGIIVAITSAGCSHLTVAAQPVNAKTIAFSGNKQNAGIIDCDSNGCLVDANWIAKYKQMEKEFKKTFEGDKAITPDGKNFRVPFDVVDHYI